MRNGVNQRGYVMKKILALTALMLIVVMASAVPALAAKKAVDEKAQKVDWYTVTGGNSDNVTDELVPGHVNLNTPNGAVTMVINGVITLEADTEYVVWVRQLTGYTGAYINSYVPLGYYALGSFTTDEFGCGKFHFNIASSDLAPGTRDIQVAVNVDNNTTNGTTVAATEIYTEVTN